MRARCLLLIAVGLLLPALVFAQSGAGRGRRGTVKAPSPSGTYKGLAGSFHGKLKDISGKEIVLENEDGQTVAIRRTHKTKFWRDEREIKPADIPRDTLVTVEASEDIDLKPTALSLTVDSALKKPEEK